MTNDRGRRRGEVPIPRRSRADRGGAGIRVHTASRTAASEIEIIIRLKRECRFGSVLGRDWRRDGDAYVIRLGDLSAGERRPSSPK